jgi:hypothetical protein
MAKDLYPGMMGDGTEEQNLNQRGNPKARITEEEVEEAFSHDPDEPGGFSGDAAWESLKEKGAQVATSADAVRDWAADQAAAARRTATDKPVLVISASAATALALGLALGFLIGRASAE